MKLRNFTIMFLFSLFFGLGIGSAAVYPVNNVEVTATIHDDGGQVWGNSSVTMQLYNPSSTQPPVWTATGQKLTASELKQTMEAGTDGTFTFSAIPDNLSISPSGTTWKLIICPSATTPCQTTPKGIVITGNSEMDISSFIQTNIQPFTIVPGLITFAYSSVELVNPVAGSSYIESDPNADDYLSMYGYDGFNWQLISNGGGGGFSQYCNTIPGPYDDYVCTDPEGYQDIYQNSQTSLQIFGGFEAGNPNNQNTYIGNDTDFSNDPANDNQGSTNVLLGYGMQDLVTSLSTYEEIGIGSENLRSDSSGYGNIAIGNSELVDLTDSRNNIAIGSDNLISLTTGGADNGDNIAIGDSAGEQQLAGNSIFIGNEAGYNETTNDNQMYVNNINYPEPDLAADRGYSLFWCTFSDIVSSLSGQQCTFNGETYTMNAALDLPISFEVGGGTPITSESSTGTQVVNCSPESGTPSDYYCAADGTWKAPPVNTPGTATITTDGTSPGCVPSYTCNSFGGYMEATAGSNTMQLVATFSVTLSHLYNCSFSEADSNPTTMSVITYDSTTSAFTIAGDTVSGTTYKFTYVCSPD